MSSTQVPDMLVTTYFRPSLLTPFVILTTPQQRFSFIRLPISHLTASSAAFFWNVHHHGSLPQQLPVV